jgi:hypothetical protein
MFAEMSSDQFLKRSKQIVDLYSNLSNFDESSYAAIVYDNRLQWRMCNGQRSSNLYAMALYVIICSKIYHFRCNNIRTAANRKSSSTIESIDRLSSPKTSTYIDGRNCNNNNISRRSTISQLFGW